jgi:hypothetical protein
MDILMQPKYSQWIAYEHDQFFFDNRKIRMICPPKANIPVINKYRDESYPRRYRVALIPPTEQLVIMLTQFDSEFVHREFRDKIRHIQPGRRVKYKLWLKIIHVEIVPHVTATGAIDGSKLTRTDIFLADMSSDCQPAILSLYDEKAHLASIFKRNDYIGIYDPVIESTRGTARASGRGERPETIFEYAEDTVIFLMPEKEAQEAGLAKINLTSMIMEDEDDANSIPDPTKKDIVERDEEVC